MAYNAHEVPVGRHARRIACIVIADEVPQGDLIRMQPTPAARAAMISCSILRRRVWARFLWAVKRRSGRNIDKARRGPSRDVAS
jgi:hypothetical protein